MFVKKLSLFFKNPQLNPQLNSPLNPQPNRHFKALIAFLSCAIILTIFNQNCFAQSNHQESNSQGNFNIQSEKNSKNQDFFSRLFPMPQRNHLHLVGSSTLYPFISAVAENFGREEEYKTPVVEATGTGGGFKLFCAGIGTNFPDFVNASRKIQNSEIEKCAQNNIRNIGEIKIGYDGIVLANSNLGNKYSLSLLQIFYAIAKEIPNPKNPDQLIVNPYKKWREIDKNLPDKKIAIYGPPSTSGTRDAFVELVMQKACLNLSAFVKNYSDEKIRAKKCQLIRSDGIFIEAGENDNLIVAKLKNNHDALGIFGFSFLEENHQLLQASAIESVEPSLDSIIKGNYKISRPLFVYYKKEHLELMPSMEKFIEEIISKNTLGNEGYLLQKGLIPLNDLELKNVRDQIQIDLNQK